MKAELLKQTTDAELEKYHSREEVLVSRGIREVVEWVENSRTTPMGVDAYGYYIWEGALKVQKKVWGIE